MDAKDIAIQAAALVATITGPDHPLSQASPEDQVAVLRSAAESVSQSKEAQEMAWMRGNFRNWQRRKGYGG
jgi:hypothetical protein